MSLMKDKIIFLLPVVFALFHGEIFGQEKKAIHKLIFESYMEVLEEPWTTKLSRSDSMINASFDPKKGDSAVVKILRSDEFWTLQAEASRSELVYELDGDAIWTYFQKNGVQIGHTFLYRPNSILVEEYDLSRKIKLRSFSAIPEKRPDLVEREEDGPRKFMDLNVYPQRETYADPEIGKTFHQLLLTQDIKLPSSINLAAGRQLSDGLIVERIEYSEAFTNLRNVFRLKEIVYWEEGKTEKEN